MYTWRKTNVSLNVLNKNILNRVRETGKKYLKEFNKNNIHENKLF